MTLRVIGLPLGFAAFHRRDERTKGTQEPVNSVDSNQYNQINRNKQDEIRDR